MSALNEMNQELRDKCSTLINSGISKWSQNIQNIMQSNLSSGINESPIELLMAASFIHLNIAGDGVVKVFYMPIVDADNNFEYLNELTKFNAGSVIGKFIWILPQCRFHTYRVDFMCAAILDKGKYDNIMHLAVECDGHEFHIMDKQQAAKDRKKDRLLLQHNIPVMRFTGSEIWNDALECAKEVVAYFGNKIEDAQY